MPLSSSHRQIHYESSAVHQVAIWKNRYTYWFSSIRCIFGLLKLILIVSFRVQENRKIKFLFQTSQFSREIQIGVYFPFIQRKHLQYLSHLSISYYRVDHFRLMIIIIFSFGLIFTLVKLVFYLSFSLLNQILILYEVCKTSTSYNIKISKKNEIRFTHTTARFWYAKLMKIWRKGSSCCSCLQSLKFPSN